MSILRNTENDNEKDLLPKGYPAEPSEDAVCGYLAGLGPFYNKTKNEIALNESERKQLNKTRTSRVTFAGATEEILIETSQQKQSSFRIAINNILNFINNEILPPKKRNAKKRIRRRYSKKFVLQYRYNKIGFVFVGLSIGLLSLSTAFVLIAFFTKYWGIVKGSSNPTEFEGYFQEENDLKFDWNFGLWICCREDGICWSHQWPTFYGVTRMFSILSLFGHVFSLAWLIGYTLEKLMKYDLCTMATLISLTIFTCICSLIAVLTFGICWGPYFKHRFDSQVDLDMGFSFYLAVLTVPLMASTAVTLIIDLRSEWRLQEIKKQFGSL